MNQKVLPSIRGISVVIPTMNRADVLLDTISDLVPQTFQDWELIVVDQSDGPNDNARSQMKRIGVPARYEYVTHFRGLPDARNYGWQAANKDIVLYIDDDIRCEPGFLQAHFDAHLNSGVSMVAGGITEIKGDMASNGRPGVFNWWTASSTRNFHLRVAQPCLHAPGGNFSIRRDVLQEVGGFDENLSVGAALYEETELALRVRNAGYGCWFEPSAHLVHLAAPMGGCRVGPDIERYMFGMAHNRAILIYRHLRPWHRPTALFRMVLYGLSYSRNSSSFAPLVATFRGIAAGRKAAAHIKVDTTPALHDN